MGNSMIFYESFYEALKELKPIDRAKVYDAVFGYVFGGEEPELSGASKMAWILIKPQIDANIKRRENGEKGAELGKKGGRPKKEKTIGVSEKNPIGVIEKNPIGVSDENPKEVKPKTPNVNVNDNVNVNVNNNTPSKAAAFEGEFEDVWNQYPRKQGKQDALKAYIKARKDGVSQETIVSGIKRYVDYIKAKGIEEQYVKQGSTWFHQHCWDDDYTCKPPDNGFMQGNIGHDDLHEILMLNMRRTGT